MQGTRVHRSQSSQLRLCFLFTMVRNVEGSGLNDQTRCAIICVRSFMTDLTNNETRVRAAVSGTLERLRVHGVVQHHVTLRGSWAFDVNPEPEYACVYIVTRGAVWAHMDSQQPIRVRSGSVVLARPGTRHTMAQPRHAEPIDARRFFANCETTFPLHLRSGQGRPLVELVTGFFRFPRHDANPLMDSLPPLLVLDPRHMASASGKTGAVQGSMLQQSVAELESELKEHLPGDGPVVNRLAEILLIRLIRAWSETPAAAQAPGLISGLGDPCLARALEAMHAQPANNWTVATLGKIAGLSRTGFAMRFVARVGCGPATYLRRLRLHKACALLEDRDLGVAEVGAQVGYASEAAFKRAFKRELGVSPTVFRGRAPVINSLTWVVGEAQHGL